MKIFKFGATIPALALALSAGVAQAGSVTPDVIFGSGNANGSFTINQQNGIELGLRGKLRFNDSNVAENTFNYDGVDTYTFRNGTPPTGFGFAAGSPTTPVWNFEWTINTDFAGSTGNALDDFDYLLELDTDPGAGTSFVGSFDPINLAFADHAIGTNATGNGGGSVAADATAYAAAIASNNVAQNSWSYEFFNDPGGPTFGFSPAAKGDYLIRLTAYDKGTTDIAAQTAITISAVPLPAAGWLLLSAFAGLGIAARRRRKAA